MQPVTAINIVIVSHKFVKNNFFYYKPTTFLHDSYNIFKIKFPEFSLNWPKNTLENYTFLWDSCESDILSSEFTQCFFMFKVQGGHSNYSKISNYDQVFCQHIFKTPHINQSASHQTNMQFSKSSVNWEQEQIDYKWGFILNTTSFLF